MTDHVQSPQSSTASQPPHLLQSSSNASSAASLVCCELFIETLNQTLPNFESSSKTPVNQNTTENTSSTIKESLKFADVVSFISYCQNWEIKQCVCVFTNDDLLDKFHHFLHNIISTAIEVLRHFPEDFANFENEDYFSKQRPAKCATARRWTLDEKEKLLMALVKIFSLNMPLYVTYKHLLFNHGRYARIGECSCAELSNDSIALVQIFCQASVSGSGQKIQVDSDNVPIELLRNISHFVDLNGLTSIKACFTNSNPDNLPLKIAHIIFNIIVNIRLWLNPIVIEQQISSMRSQAIHYMCQLSDKDLRIVGTKNTTELMYESFKELGSFYMYDLVSDQASSTAGASGSFCLDKDGLTLALKYFMCSTLTIRLGGVSQMNLQISAWSDFSSLCLAKASAGGNGGGVSGSSIVAGEPNELADWFVKNKIIEHLFGPNLHVEVVKRSQDIMNFLAFTNRLSESHLSVIWTSAQLKHCSKPVMDMLMSLHKHLDTKSIKYLSGLIAKLEITQHTEQTLLLSALLTKSIWFTMLDTRHIKRTKKLGSSSLSNGHARNGNKQTQHYRNLLKEKELKIKMLNYQKSTNKANSLSNKARAGNYVNVNNYKKRMELIKKHEHLKRLRREGQKCAGESGNSNNEQTKEAIESDYLDGYSGQDNNCISLSSTEEDEDIDDENASILGETQHVAPQKIRARHNQSMETHVNGSDTENNYEYTAFSNKNKSMSHKLSEETGTETNDETNDDLLDDFDDAEELDEIGSESESDETNNATGCDTGDMKETEDLMHDEEINRVFVNSNIGSGGEASKFLMSSSRQSCVNPTVKNLKNRKGVMSGDSLLDEMSSQESTSDSTTAESSDSMQVSESSQTSMSPMVSDEEDEEDIETLKSNCIEKLLRNEQLALVQQQEQKESVIEKETKVREIDELEKKFKQIVDYDESESLGCEDDDNDEEDEDDLEDTIQNDLVTGNDITDPAIDFDLANICSSGNTFLWDLLVTQCSSEDNSATNNNNNDTQTNPIEESADSMFSETHSDVPSKTNQNQRETILKEAEKQLQTLLCLPSTDKRIRFKFIENCLQNLSANRACVFSLRLLTKLFSSFQQYSIHSSLHTNSSMATQSQHGSLKQFSLERADQSTISHSQELLLATSPLANKAHSGYSTTCTSYATNIPSNIVEVHKIVALTEHNYAMMSTFFENLAKFTQEKIVKLNSIHSMCRSRSNSLSVTEDSGKATSTAASTTNTNTYISEQIKLDLLNQIRLNVQTRLQFLSFVYSTLGSPRDFELTRKHIEILWDCLVQFNDLNATTGLGLYVSIRDDLFNWFLNQAKSKDQHAISIDAFKLIFTDKIPHLDPNNFSQTALHLYQELFKIYKYSFHQQQQLQQANNSTEDGTDLANLMSFKQIESAAIDYIWKLAFKSTIEDVSMAAVQFLNSHFAQPDTIACAENESQFVQGCMGFLNEACQRLKSLPDLNLSEKKTLEFLHQQFSTIERGLILLKRHLDSYYSRHSFQLRQWQLKHQDTAFNELSSEASNEEQLSNKNTQTTRFLSHLKLLEQIGVANGESSSTLFKQINTIVNTLTEKPAIEQQNKDNFQVLNANTTNIFNNSQSNSINLIFHINQSQFKFSLKIRSSEFMGDLRAIAREIILRILKKATEVVVTKPGSSPENKANNVNVSLPNQFAFMNNKLTSVVSKGATSKTNLNPSMNADLTSLFKSIVENEDAFYIKLFTNGQELTSQSHSNSMLIDAKPLSALGLKDMQLIHVTLFSRTSTSSPTARQQQQQQHSTKITKESIPMLILSNEANFSSLFNLLTLISTFNTQHLTKLGIKTQFADLFVEKSELLSSNLWDLIVLLPTNCASYKLISARPEWHLNNLAEELISSEPTSQMSSSPYKLLYYLQIIEVIHKNLTTSGGQKMNQENVQLWSNQIYKLLKTLTTSLLQNNQSIQFFEQKFQSQIDANNSMSETVMAKPMTSLSSVVLLDCLLVTIRLLFNSLCAKESTLEAAANEFVSFSSSNDNSVGSNNSSFNESKHLIIDTPTALEVSVDTGDISCGETPSKKSKRTHLIDKKPTALFNWTHTFNWNLFNRMTSTKSTAELTVSGIKSFIQLLFDIQTLTASLILLPNTSLTEPSSNTRIELLFYTMQMLTLSLLSDDNTEPAKLEMITQFKSLLMNKGQRSDWLRMLLLIENNSNSQFRFEASVWIYRLCILEQYQYNTNQQLGNVVAHNPCLLSITLKELLGLLDMAVKLKPTDYEFFNCKDYLLLIANLILNMDIYVSEMIGNVVGMKPVKLMGMNELMMYIANELKERDYYEVANQSGTFIEDDVLIGMLSLALAILKNQQYYFMLESREEELDKERSPKRTISVTLDLIKEPCIVVLNELFDYLFEITSIANSRSANSEHNQQIARLPKCRSVQSRALCFDMITELCRSNLENYKFMNKKLIDLHKSLTITTGPFSTNIDSILPAMTHSYTWDYWPRDDSRSPCGYVGLVNLGATCYMATAMQQLFAIKEARDCILRSKFQQAEQEEEKEAASATSTAITKTASSTKNYKDKDVYDKILMELKRMFAFLQESERKAYNPKEFCRFYTMDQQPLNTAEQKDMQEFFTDLISKLEETSNTELKELIKSLFGGTITNLVISLDCPHVSCTLEEFYTIRCQVAGMKDLYDSLNEITVKDTLDGDNMYTCSKCSKKVRAEKRACFRQLPQILCFNTMRYTFNMVTMLKEKVNTHFSFPLELNMSGYMEKNLIPSASVFSASNSPSESSSTTNETIVSNNSEEPVSPPVTAEASPPPVSVTSDNDQQLQDETEDESFVYELIGVTVHTGTAEGGHYYSFIRERNPELNGGVEPGESTKAKWHLFNDADVKPFDATNHLASECFGGETTSKTYDSSSDKFMDLSFEKTNSAYMLFYEKKRPTNNQQHNNQPVVDQPEQIVRAESINDSLMKSIWSDNIKFMNDKQILDHAYFNFVWQMCNYVPRAIICSAKNTVANSNGASPSLTSLILATKLGISFILEVYVHSRDKPQIIHWVEMLTKYFNASSDACLWLINYLCDSPGDSNGFQWCTKVFFKCPNSALRHMCQTLFLVALNKVFKKNQQLTEKFIQFFVGLINLYKSTKERKRGNNMIAAAGCKFNVRFMPEYFNFLLEFARGGMEQCLILIKAGAIDRCCKFYLANRHPKTSAQRRHIKQMSLVLGVAGPNPVRKTNNSSMKTAVVDDQGITEQEHRSNSERKQKRTKKSRNRKVSKQGSEISSEAESISSNDADVFSNSSSPSSSASSLLSSSSQSDSTDSLLYISSTSGSSTASSVSGDEEILPMPDQKSKLKVFEKILALISLLSERNAQYHHSAHHCPQQQSNSTAISFGSLRSLKKKQKLKLNFFYKAILDDVNFNYVKTIILSLIRINNCCSSHSQVPADVDGNKKEKRQLLFAEKFIDMCCRSIQQIQEKNTTGNDRAIPFFNIFGNSCMGLLEVDTKSLSPSACASVEVDENSPTDNQQDQSMEDEACTAKKKKPNEGCVDCLKCDTTSHVNFTPMIILRLELLFASAPYNTLQWLASVCYANRPIQEWLLDNMSLWVKPLLINHKQTNIRFSAAILLANLVPNRSFRETFTSNRNMLVPFNPSSNNSSNSLPNLTANHSPSNNSSVHSGYNQPAELNYDFDSENCKNILHRIIKYLFSIIDELGQFVGNVKSVVNDSKNNSMNSKDSSAPTSGNEGSTGVTKLPTTSNRLVQYFTFLIYCMSSRAEKRLFSQYQQTMDKFWTNVYYPHIANNHVCVNLNKQVAVHFFYQALLNCEENVGHVLQTKLVGLDQTSGCVGDKSTKASVNAAAGIGSDAGPARTKLVFVNRIARELPMCTVAVDHEDTDLISYNRQCLYPYYASIRLLCQHSAQYTREMSTHSNFQWAFKHIMPYSNQYSNAVQELNKCVQLFLHQRLPTKPETSMNAKKKKTSCDQQKKSNKGAGILNAACAPTTPKVNNNTDENQSDEKQAPKEDEISCSEEEIENDEDEDEEEESDETLQLQQLVSNFKETLATTFLMNQDIDTKQSWQSIIMVMKSMIETLEDGTLVLTRRGLSVVSICFFHICVLHHSNGAGSANSQTGGSENSAQAQNCTSLNYDLCECMQILMQLCETVKHHLDKRTDGIRQIIQAWKEKNELCKRALMLVNFHNINEVRTRALELVRMVLSVSPNDTLQYVIQIIYVSFLSSQSQICMSFTVASCNTNNSSHPTSSANANVVKGSQQQCLSPVHLISQAVHLMGPNFPLYKKIHLNQISSNMRAPKPVFNMFLPVMFVGHNHLNGAILLQNHSQITQQNSAQHQANLDYEKLLLDSYVPFLTFFDWLCRNTFNRRLTSLTASENNTTTASSSSTTTNIPTFLQTTKHLVDLILIVSQQSIFLNVSFISYLNNFLTLAGSVQQQQTISSDQDEATTASDSGNMQTPSVTEFHQLIAQSAHLNPFVSTILNDYRYLLNKKEIYEFIHLVLPSYILNLKTGNGAKVTNTSPGSAGNSSVKASTFLITLKSYIERCCQSINEIRFYFEFQQLSKHLTKFMASNVTSDSNTTAASSPFSPLKKPSISSTVAPNITNNIEFKSSQILGSIKAIYLLVAVNMSPASSSSSSLDNADNVEMTGSDVKERVLTSEDYSLFKFKLELKVFLTEIVDYLRVQISEMNGFIVTYEDPSEPDEVLMNENGVEKKQGDETDEIKATIDNETDVDDSIGETDSAGTSTNKHSRPKQSFLQKSKKLKPNEAETEEKEDSLDPTTHQKQPISPSTLKEPGQTKTNPTQLSALIRQVEMKRKYLEHVIQVLRQTLSFLVNSLEASTHLMDISSANNSSTQSSSHPSSTTSSEASSPVHTSESIVITENTTTATTIK